jgi:SAM-dependent methyltransferase
VRSCASPRPLSLAAGPNAISTILTILSYAECDANYANLFNPRPPLYHPDRAKNWSGNSSSRPIANLARTRLWKGQLDMSQVRDGLREWIGVNYMKVGRKIWWRLPDWSWQFPPVRWYGMHLHAIVQQTDSRDQNHMTLFFRNRAELRLLTRLAEQKESGADLDIAVLGCSKGTEVYSIIAELRQTRPDLNIKVCGVDISAEILEFAKEGTYSLNGSDHQTARDQRGISIFERVTPIELGVMFDRQGDQLKVKPWLQEGIRWYCGSVDDPNLSTVLGPQDIVVANRFLCHMQPASAERSLRNIARLVKPGGYLFASGVDLDVRAKVAKELGWESITEMMKEVYEGDRILIDGWPTEYWANEPFRATQRDWTTRYSAAFRLGPAQKMV